MKKILFALPVLLLGIFFLTKIGSYAKIKKHIAATQYQNGDIIFQETESKQCEAIKAATHSKYSHCGILFNDNNLWYVLEAVEPVQIIPLQDFIMRNKQQHYAIKRLKKEYPLAEKDYTAMYEQGKLWIDKHYDIYFNWSMSELYCSELVWKLYNDVAHIKLCATKQLKQYDLSAPIVQQIMHERYGTNIPYTEPMAAPIDLYNSSMLEVVEEK